jgi:hypothetical protein
LERSVAAEGHVEVSTDLSTLQTDTHTLEVKEGRKGAGFLFLDKKGRK